jgi:hypothetical protein
MKFKKSKEDRDVKSVRVKDGWGDELILNWLESDNDMFVYVGGSVGVQLKRSKAIKLALAILDELAPGQLDPGHTWE